MAEIGKTVLDSGWLAARSTEVHLSGTQLTTTHSPTGPNKPWMEAAVPGTVLGTLVKNKVVPDPFYGLENEAIIDIADSGREYYTFWFFTTFQCKLSANQHLDLNFRGINYSAELYLNGNKKILPKGMFRRHSLDVTDILHPDGQNFLAVLVYPPDHPGTIPPEGGQGGDHEIGKDVTTQYVEGWDWMTPIRDRNTGIWDEVSISITGPVKIIDPHLVSTFYDDYKRIYLHTITELENKSSSVVECDLNIQVTSELEGGVCIVEHLQTQHLSIPSGNRVQHAFPQLFFYKPNLWWPNGMGRQALYNVTITVDVKGHGESDSWSHMHGFRKIESYIDSATGGRLFKVNGQPIFIRGGNWILSDGLLRLSKKRYQTDIKFHADMNFNMIRCWGGGLAERPEFYHYCDIYGLLVWQEFWITGDVDGRGVPVSNPNGPLDHDLFMLCARDTVKLLRNHPSLALWVGGNEQVPPPDINNALKDELKLHPHFESLHNTGNCCYHKSYNASGKDGKFRCLRKLPNGYIEEVPNPIWEYHKYIPYSKAGKVHNQILLYGTPTDLNDFCLKAQLVNYIQYRALLEGWTSRMWSKYTGVLIWKTQNPWTGLRGQFYDHLHDQTAGFYGCRSAAEPVHVQLNLATYFIEAVNTLSEQLSDVAIEASVWDLEGTCPYYVVHEKLSVPSKKTELFTGCICLVETTNCWSHTGRREFPLRLHQTLLSKGPLMKWKCTSKTNPKNQTLKSLTCKNNFVTRIGDGDFDMASLGPVNSAAEKKQEASLFQRIYRRFSGENDDLQATRKEKIQEFSQFITQTTTFHLYPGEVMPIKISFEVPPGVTPRIRLHGWNYHSGHKVY
ncbi:MANNOSYLGLYCOPROTEIN ENDO-BETA-MANNOSIDASE [Salix koriyanagi]|uniref:MANNOSYLGLYCOPROTEIN ENDO-BETA-MANNOSIDASE n=1 Tax=Salix koriyanagi TaxID=2511006 RepID=A0A9Q1A3Q9_9ROSI|nr:MANNOSYLGLYCOPROTEIN ENDO-BETA-MANNOSIDASE [Salix koriyanagi]